MEPDQPNGGWNNENLEVSYNGSDLQKLRVTELTHLDVVLACFEAANYLRGMFPRLLVARRAVD